MTQRTFNFTGRKRIHRDHVRIGVSGAPPVATFSASWNLEAYDFPLSSRVIVEAQAGWTSQRFEFGTLGARLNPASVTLSEFESLSGLMFRLKIVGVGDLSGLIVGEADALKPSGPVDDAAQRSFIVVRPTDLGEVSWRVSFDEHQALLLVNSRIADHHSFFRRADVAALVMPEVLRQVLGAAIERGDDEESEGWPAHALRLAESLVKEPPPSAELDEQSEEWIDGVVSRFATRFSLMQRSSFAVMEDPES